MLTLKVLGCGRQTFTKLIEYSSLDPHFKEIASGFESQEVVLQQEQNQLEGLPVDGMNWKKMSFKSLGFIYLFPIGVSVCTR